MVQDLLVDVADEVDQALLLGAAERVVDGIKIGDQHPLEPLQHLPQELALPRRFVHEHDLFQVREHPHVSFTGS
jgi:hypothetical protein